MIIGISGKIGSGKDTVGEIIQYYTYCKTGYAGAIATEKDCELYLQGYYDKVETLVEEISTFKIKKFADKLKDMVCLLLSCTREQLEDREFKEAELPEEWRIWSVWVSFTEGTKIFASKEAAEKFHCEVWDDTGTHIKSYIPTPRLLLQLIGTECGREILHPNIWVNALMSEYKTLGFENKDAAVLEFPNWIITDMRFPNELEAVKKRGGITIRVNRRLSNKGELNDIFKKEHPSETALDNAKFDYSIDNNGSILDLIAKVKEILTREKII